MSESVKLTKAQQVAADVLAHAEGQGRAWVDGWRQSSRMEPCPMVNVTAALGLCRLKLACVGYAYHGKTEFQLTAAGREALAASPDDPVKTTARRER